MTPKLRMCPQCGRFRRVVDKMGNNYDVLGTCGHVVPIDKSTEAPEIGSGTGVHKSLEEFQNAKEESDDALSRAEWHIHHARRYGAREEFEHAVDELAEALEKIIQHLKEGK